MPRDFAITYCTCHSRCVMGFPSFVVASLDRSVRSFNIQAISTNRLRSSCETRIGIQIHRRRRTQQSFPPASLGTVRSRKSLSVQIQTDTYKYIFVLQTHISVYFYEIPPNRRILGQSKIIFFFYYTVNYTQKGICAISSLGFTIVPKTEFKRDQVVPKENRDVSITYPKSKTSFTTIILPKKSFDQFSFIRVYTTFNAFETSKQYCSIK